MLRAFSVEKSRRILPTFTASFPTHLPALTIAKSTPEKASGFDSTTVKSLSRQRTLFPAFYDTSIKTSFLMGRSLVSSMLHSSVPTFRNAPTTAKTYFFNIVSFLFYLKGSLISRIFSLPYFIVSDISYSTWCVCKNLSINGVRFSSLFLMI